MGVNYIKFEFRCCGCLTFKIDSKFASRTGLVNDRMEDNLRTIILFHRHGLMMNFNIIRQGSRRNDSGRSFGIGIQTRNGNVLVGYSCTKRYNARGRNRKFTITRFSSFIIQYLYVIKPISIIRNDYRYRFRVNASKATRNRIRRARRYQIRANVEYAFTRIRKVSATNQVQIGKTKTGFGECCRDVLVFVDNSNRGHGVATVDFFAGTIKCQLHVLQCAKRNTLFLAIYYGTDKCFTNTIEYNRFILQYNFSFKI